MPSRIPAFDHNLVLPAHIGNPTSVSDLSPYPCTSLELCERFATSEERIEILELFLNFREQLQIIGLHNGFQWLDGSFMEDIEAQEGRAPRDLDVITLYFSYDLTFQGSLNSSLPEFFDSQLAKANFKLDHYPFDATQDSKDPFFPVQQTRYWVQLFSHNRNGVWKGMVSIQLNTPEEDLKARKFLNSLKP